MIKFLKIIKSLNLLWIVLFIVVLTLVIGISSYGAMPTATLIHNFNPGNKKYFWVSRESDARQEPVVKNQKIVHGGRLSIPTDGSSWASLIFEGEQKYQGLIVQTTPMSRVNRNSTIYKFPCGFQGQFIIAWDANGEGSCRDEKNKKNGGIKIISDPKEVFDKSKSSSTDEDIGVDNKQSSSKPKTDDLSVVPEQGQTIIRVTSEASSGYTEPLEPCTPEETARGEGAWCRRKIPIETEAVSIDVLKGNILVKSEEKPQERRVKEGQRYSYPEESFGKIDTSEEAKCKILNFLNPVSWISSDTSRSIADGIAAQLKQHREALGVSGRPPKKLSPLEQGIFEEMNLARTNPSAYANLLEKQKQYFYSNYLDLSWDPVDSKKRENAVDEAISSLRKQPTLFPFSISTGMSRANRDHVNNQGRSGKNFGHTDDDKIGAGTRLNRYGSVECAKGGEDDFEDIVYFKQPTERVSPAQAVVMEMLLNYRPRSTGNSNNLFNADFQVTGVACGSHIKLGEMCVITYAEGYLEKS